MDKNFLAVFGKYAKGMLMNKSVFDQRMELPYSGFMDVKKWIISQNNKLCSSKCINQNCTMVEHMFISFWVLIRVTLPFFFKYSRDNLF